MKGFWVAQRHDKRAGRAPWHMWSVGLLLLFWNAMSCFSQVMTLTRNAAYFRATGVTPQIAAYFAALPAWYIVAWTLGVWGGLVASVGLLMRKSWSVWVFAASQLAMVVNSVATLGNSNAQEVLGRVGSISAIAVIVLGAFMVLYSLMVRRCLA